MGFSPGGRLCSVTRAQPPPQGAKAPFKVARRGAKAPLFHSASDFPNSDLRILTSAISFLHSALGSIRPSALDPR